MTDAVTVSWLPEALKLDPIPLIVQFGLKLPVVAELPGTIPLDQPVPALLATYRRLELRL